MDRHAGDEREPRARTHSTQETKQTTQHNKRHRSHPAFSGSPIIKSYFASPSAISFGSGCGILLRCSCHHAPCPVAVTLCFVAASLAPCSATERPSCCRTPSRTCVATERPSPPPRCSMPFSATTVARPSPRALCCAPSPRSSVNPSLVPRPLLACTAIRRNQRIILQPEALNPSKIIPSEHPRHLQRRMVMVTKPSPARPCSSYTRPPPRPTLPCSPKNRRSYELLTISGRPHTTTTTLKHGPWGSVAAARAALPPLRRDPPPLLRARPAGLRHRRAGIRFRCPALRPVQRSAVVVPNRDGMGREKKRERARARMRCSRRIGRPNLKVAPYGKTRVGTSPR